MYITLWKSTDKDYFGYLRNHGSITRHYYEGLKIFSILLQLPVFEGTKLFFK